MRRSSRFAVTAVLLTPAVRAAVLARPAESQTPKSGGSLKIMLREDTPQGFAVHESATVSTVWPSSPCCNNLVYFDPLKPKESTDTIIGELAEKWSWQDNYRNLVFFLRKDVKWHDGKPPRGGRAVRGGGNGSTHPTPTPSLPLTRSRSQA